MSRAEQSLLNVFISETNCQFQMALVSILAFFLFCHLPLILNSAEEYTTKPICPPSFNCQDLGEFKFPFFNSTDWRCGFCKLNCTEKVPQLQLSEEGGQLYDVKHFVNHNTIVIYDKVFQSRLDKRDCDSLRNFSLPSSPSISFTISNTITLFITLFKCLKTSNLTGKQKPFGDYKKYSECNEHNLYYRYPIDNLPNRQDLPDDCSVIQLPADSDSTGKDASDFFNLLSAQFTLQFQFSPSCHDCLSREGQCQNDKDKFHCADAKEKGPPIHGQCQNDDQYCANAKENRPSIDDQCQNDDQYCANTKGKRSMGLILGTAIPGAGLIIFLVIIIIWRRKKWSNLSTYFLPRKTSSDIEDGSSYYGVPVFSYKDLEEATHNFDPSKKLGDGGFGTVYHGKLRDGREVAVKRLYEHNYKRVEQFMNEIDILTRLRHRNLVLLYGSTSHRSRELLLVYEYIPNGTVADHLHGDKAETEPLTWPVRMNIAIETASALTYLHKSDIIHRDVKTNNILLDNNFCVKVADFGLSRLFPTDVTHVSTAPQGTPGYVDPEYHQCYQLTDKSDVYSFGVVLIELISSLPAVDISRQRNEINLAKLAIDRIQRCAFNELIDPSLGHESDANIERMTTCVAELAFRCLQLDKDLRPTMDEVLDSLRQIQGVDVSRSGMPPPSPEAENVVLLKEEKLQDSPVGFADKWMSSRSTTPSTSG